MRDYIREMLGGPGSFRFLVQPAIALLLGIRDGLRDHRRGSPPYLLALATEPGERRQLLLSALRKILIPLGLAMVASCLFQYLIVRRIHLTFALVYATLFVAAPYIFCRALVNRADEDYSRRRSS